MYTKPTTIHRIIITTTNPQSRQARLTTEKGL